MCGSRTRLLRVLALQRGVRCVVCGVRCVVCGVRCVMCGVWCVVCCVLCVVVVLHVGRFGEQDQSAASRHIRKVFVRNGAQEAFKVRVPACFSQM
jgi:hypothetical protein